MGKGARYVSRHTHTHSQRPLLRIQHPEAHGRFGVRCFYAPFSVPSQCPCKMPARANLADTRGICECNQGPLWSRALEAERGDLSRVSPDVRRLEEKVRGGAGWGVAPRASSVSSFVPGWVASAFRANASRQRFASSFVVFSTHDDDPETASERNRQGGICDPS